MVDPEMNAAASEAAKRMAAVVSATVPIRPSGYVGPTTSRTKSTVTPDFSKSGVSIAPGLMYQILISESNELITHVIVTTRMPLGPNSTQAHFVNMATAALDMA